MNRRGFLRLLGGAAPAIIHPTYFFAPRGGWPYAGQTWANNSYGLSTNWSHKTADEVQADVKEMMEKFKLELATAVMIPPSYLFGKDHDLDATRYMRDIPLRTDDTFAQKFLLGDWDVKATEIK
jgi:hypothetical protein